MTPDPRRASRPAGGSRAGPVATGVCASCGDAAVDLVAVTRLYVVPESWDSAGSVTEAEGTERWCFPCRTHYPHRVVDV